MIKKGVYAATLSVLNEISLNVEETISHAENIIKRVAWGFFLWLHRGQKPVNFNG